VAAILVGWVLLISGVGTVIGSFSIHGTGPFFGALQLGLLSFAAGVFMLFNPLAGAAALTLVMGVIFVFQGAFELFFAFENAPASRLGGHADLRRCEHVMAVLIVAGWPAISVVVLGILSASIFLAPASATSSHRVR
jgi:uncharacterized membrane protein HdeD (DUF308 family)